MTTWTPVAKQGETWTSQDQGLRTFSPSVFSLHPVFDTGKTAGGYWPVKSKQDETWTTKAVP